MRASSGLVAGSLSGAYSHSGHGYSNSLSARLNGPRPACGLRRLFVRGMHRTAADTGPSSPRAAAATCVPAHKNSSSSPLRVSTAAVLCGSSSSRLGRPIVQAAAGRGSGGGRAGGGSSASGRGRGSGRDPADDMSVCRTLEELQILISQRLSVWEGRKDFITMCAAFNLCAKLESSGGAAATAVARSSIIGALAPAYLPLVPRIRNAMNCSIPLWALGKAGVSSSGGTEAQLAAALLERLVDPEVLKTARPQALSNAMYGTSKLREALEYRSAVEALCGEALRRLRKTELAAAFSPQHLSNILLALQGLQLGGKQAGLVAAVAAEGVRRGFDGYIAQDLSNSAWALAKMGFGVGPEAPAEQRQWVSAAVDAAMRPGVMAQSTQQAWANLLYALSVMRHQPPPELLDSGAAVAAIRAGRVNGQECANTLYAMAVLQLRHSAFETAVCSRLGELLQRDRQALNHQGIANSLWAMAVFGDAYSPGMQQLAVQLACDAADRWEEFTAVADLTQLWQAQQELGGEVAAALGSSPGLQAAMAAAVKAERGNNKPLPETQKQVVAALWRLEQQGREAAGAFAIQSLQTGVYAPGVLTPVDAVVRLSDGQQAAVELLGPTRFLSSRKRHDRTAVDGRTVLRHRQLRRAFGEGGVLLMPYSAWDELTTAQEQEAYLLRRLQQPAVAVDAVSGAAAVITAAPHQPATTTTTTKGSGGPRSNPKQQLLVRPARRPEGGGGGRGGSGRGGR